MRCGARRLERRVSSSFPLLAVVLFSIASIVSLLMPAAPARAMDAYATEPAYKDYPLLGPAKAKGLVIWNHGLFGTMTQYTYPPPFMFLAMAAHGWDVIKLDRNPTYETGWTSAGQRHIARLIEEGEKARDQGYAHIVFAGQSYGGAIALEAARKFPVFGVVAMAPGTGQEVHNAMVTDNWSSAIAEETYEAVGDLKTDRALFVLPVDDAFMSVDRSPKVRALMQAKGTPFLLIDKQVHTHAGGYVPLLS
jgi:pimeloyl-ACP methyl ester carboxylesterase